MEVEAGYAPIEILLDGDKTEITGYENNQDKLYTIKNTDTANAIDYTLTRRFGEEVAISKITMSLLNYTAATSPADFYRCKHQRNGLYGGQCHKQRRRCQRLCG